MEVLVLLSAMRGERTPEQLVAGSGLWMQDMLRRVCEKEKME